MYHCEVCEIGRESVKSVNASILATLIKELVNKFEKTQNSKQQHRKYYVKCKEKLELTPKKTKKIGDDEGFESDVNEEDSLSGELSNEDAQSTTSSCCLIEDHVFKSSKTETLHQNSYEKDPTSLVSIIGSIDSANSSGSSDTDELDMHSLTPSPVSQSKKQTKLSHSSYILDVNHEKKQGKIKKEEYSIGDVIFCHTEPKFPNVIAWVIKKQQSEADCGSRLGSTGVENYSKIENCLEVIVVKCKSGDNLKDLCSSYQEYSKRIKLDQYKTTKRKRDEKHMSMTSATSICSKDVKVSLSDMKIANSSLIKASELSILNPKIMTSFKNDLKNSVSLNSLIKPEQTVHNIKVNQDPKTNQSLHTSVKKTQSLMNLSKTWDLKSDTLSRDGGLYKDKISSFGDHFNLIQRTDLNGVTHLEVSKSRDNTTVLTEKFPLNKSKLRKEIEGVILTDVESYAKKEQIRQRPSSDERDDSPDKIYDSPPPIRPERKKYLKKKAAAPQPLEGVQTEQKIKPLQQVNKPGSFFLTLQANGDGPIKDQKIIRGPYVRVQSWGSQNVVDTGSGTWRPEQRGRQVNKYEDKFIDRRRSKSAGRTPKKTPMAYRYVDVTNDYRGNLALKYGMPQKMREVNINLTDNTNNFRRRKSFDDIIALDNLKGNLKSVIKKNKKINDKYCEPKKVTFSAFATVQVVD